MLKIVDYYFTPTSPWAYLGHQRFVDLVMSHEAAVNLKPVDYGRIFPVSGGLPLAKRAAQRVAYRMMELKRWRAHLGIPLVLQPKCFPVDPELSARVIIAAGQNKSAVAPSLAFDFMRAVWADERNIADMETVREIIRAKGVPVDDLINRAMAPETKDMYDALTQEAIDRNVFGAPTYIYNDELFWGQDRLEFLERALTSNEATA